MDPKLIIAALGLPEGATIEQITEYAVEAKKSASIVASIRKDNSDLLEAIGAKSQADALGRVTALKSADERAAKAEGELAQIRLGNAKAKHASLISAALDPNSGSPHAGKLTPAQKSWAEGLASSESLEGVERGIETLEGFLAVAPAATKRDGLREPKRNVSGSGYSGKPYSEMTYTERAKLADSDPELFKQLSDEFEASQH